MTKDVRSHALMAGVPARQIGWVCECGQVLGKEDHRCPDCGNEYDIVGDSIVRREKNENI